MFIRRHEHDALAARAGAYDAKCAESTMLQEMLRESQKEVRRLTNVIVLMKREDQASLAPQHTDERWGSYSMEDFETPSDEKATLPQAVIDLAEKDLEEELNALLDAP